MKRIIFTLTIAALAPFVMTAQAPQCAIDLDLNKFAGKWYEIAYLQEDDTDEDNITGVTVNYTIKDDNKFYEEFRAEKKKNGKPITAVTSLTYKGNGVIKAAGGAKCQILVLDPNYQYVMVGTTDHKYVWILSRDKHLDLDIYSTLLDQAAALGFTTEQPGLMAGR